MAASGEQDAGMGRATRNVARPETAIHPALDRQQHSLNR